VQVGQPRSSGGALRRVELLGLGVPDRVVARVPEPPPDQHALQITGVRLPEGGEGEAAEQATFVVVALKRDGALAVDDTEVQWAGLGEAIAERVSAAPEAEVVVAPDADSRSEDLFRLMDALARSGWRDIRFLRQPGEGPDAGAPE
jgi:biopolymer transport protein ExbD